MNILLNVNAAEDVELQRELPVERQVQLIVRLASPTDRAGPDRSSEQIIENAQPQQPVREV